MNELKQYIASARDYGMAEAEIKQALLDTGWDIESVTQAFALAKLSPDSPVASEQKFAPRSAEFEAAQAERAEAPVKVSAATPQAAALTQRLKSLWPLLLERLKSPLGLTLAILILLLGGGLIFVQASGFDFQSLSFAGSDKFWQKFVSAAARPSAYASSFNFVYDDTQNVSRPAGDAANSLAVKFLLSGDSYLNYQDPKNPQSQSRFSFALDNAQGGLKGNFEYRLTGQTLYVNVANNPFLNSFIRLPEGAKWLKITFRDAAKDLQNDSSLSGFFSDQNANRLKAAFKDWRPRQWLAPKTFIGKEKLNGQTLWHYTAELNKTKFAADLQKLADLAAKQDNKQDADTMAAKAELAKILSLLADKAQIASLNLWIGGRDLQIHKLELESNFISIARTAENFPGQDTGELFGGNSARRLADLSSLSGALELYFNDKGGYPKSLSALLPNYLPAVPADKPASGICKDAYSPYAYQPQGNPAKSNGGEEIFSSYKILSCLGSDSGGHLAGLIAQTPQGLATTQACPAADIGCFLSPGEAAAREDQQLQSLVSEKISFAARANLTLNYSDFNQSKPVVAPDDSIDLLELLKNQFNLFIKQVQPINIR